MKDEKRIINRLQNLAIEKCLNMENCQDIADVYEKHFCKKSLANGSQKGEDMILGKDIYPEG